MVAGYAVSSFVDGFFKGRDWRDAKEDRKLDRERQKRLDEMEAQAHQLRMDEFGLRRDEFGLRQRAYEAELAQAEAARAQQQNTNSFLMELGAGMPTAPGSAAAMPAPMAAPSAPSPLGPGGFSLGVPAGQTAAPAAPTGKPAPPSPRLGFGALSSAASAMPAAAAAPVATAAAAPLKITNIQPVSAGPSQQIVPAQAMPPNPVLSTTGPGPTGLGLTELYDAGILPRRYVQDPLAPAPAAPAAVTGSGPAGSPAAMGVRTPPVPEVNPNSTAFMQDVQQVLRQGGIDGAVVRLGDALATGADGGPAASPGAKAMAGVVDYFTKSPDEAAAVSAARDGRREALDWYRSNDAKQFFNANPAAIQDAAADPAGFYAKTVAPARAKEGGSAPATVKAAEAAATSSPAPAASTEATKQAVQQVALSFGVRPGEKITEKQVQSASEAALTWYNETAVPKLMQHYVSTGQLDKAQAYAEILESNAGKKAMKLRASAAFKAVNGDIDGWGNDILSSFKAYGYVDPSFDIDEEATGVIRDEGGNFAGARLVFKDRKTGNTVEKVFQSERELIDYGLIMTDPATLVDMLSQRPEQAQSDITDKAIMETAVKLYEGSMGQLTPEQAMAQAAAMAMAARGGMGMPGAAPAQAYDPRIMGAAGGELYREQ